LAPFSSDFYLKALGLKYKELLTLPVTLHGCATWSLVPNDGYRLCVCENRMLRTIFGPKREEVTQGWKNCILKRFIMCTLLQNY